MAILVEIHVSVDILVINYLKMENLKRNIKYNRYLKKKKENLFDNHQFEIGFKWRESENFQISRIL